MRDARLALRVTQFWMQVSIGGEEDCWPWQGYVEDGYGRFYWGDKMIGAHEAALTFATGERRGNLDTCHRCNNPICCNPRHLRFDARKGNVADMMAAGTYRRGKFSDREVQIMRERYANGATQLSIANEYGITNGLVSMIVRGIRYRDSGGPIAAPRERYNHGE